MPYLFMTSRLKSLRIGKLSCLFSVKILLANGPSTEIPITCAPRDFSISTESLSAHISLVHTGDSAAGKKASTSFLPLKSSRLRFFISTSGRVKPGATFPKSGTEAVVDDDDMSQTTTTVNKLISICQLIGKPECLRSS